MKKLLLLLMSFMVLNDSFSQNYNVIDSIGFNSIASNITLSNNGGTGSTPRVWVLNSENDLFGNGNTSNYVCWVQADNAGNQSNTILETLTPVNFGSATNCYVYGRILTQSIKDPTSGLKVQFSNDNKATWTDISTFSTNFTGGRFAFDITAALGSNKGAVYYRFNFVGKNQEYSVIDYIGSISFNVDKDVIGYSASVLPYYKLNSPTSTNLFFGNLGGETITTAEFTYTDNGGTPVTTTIQNLEGIPFQYVSIPFTSNNSVLGKHEIVAYLSSVNNGSLVNTSDDTIKFEYYVINGAERTVMLEEGSGAWCGWCVDGHTKLKEILSGGGVIGSVIHNGDGMTTAEGNQINNAYAKGFPTGFIDRSVLPGMGSDIGIDRTSWSDAVDIAKNIPSPFSVEIKNFTFDSTTRKYSYDIEATATDAISGDFRITSYLIEDKVRGPIGTQFSQANYLSGRAGYENSPMYNLPSKIDGYFHNHVVTKFLTDAWGDQGDIPATVAAGEKFTKTISQTLDAQQTVTYNTTTPWEDIYYSTISGPSKNKYQDISVVAFVSFYDANDDKKRNILNATEHAFFESSPIVGLPVEDSFYVKVSDVANASTKYTDNEGHLTMTNGQKYVWKIVEDSTKLPQGWNLVSICDPLDCFNAPITSSHSFVAAGVPDQDFLKVTIEHNKIAGYGYLYIAVQEDLNPSSVVYYKFSLETVNGSSNPSTIIDDSVLVKVLTVSNSSSDNSNMELKYRNLTAGDSVTWEGISHDIPSEWELGNISDPVYSDVYADGLTNTFEYSGGSDYLKVNIKHNFEPGYGYILVKSYKSDDMATSVTSKFALFTTEDSTVGSVQVLGADEKVFYYFDKTIFVDKEFRGSDLVIYDLNGRLVTNQKIEGTVVNLKDYAKGLYIANVSKNGEVLKSIKFDNSK